MRCYSTTLLICTSPMISNITHFSICHWSLVYLLWRYDHSSLCFLSGCFCCWIVSYYMFWILNLYCVYNFLHSVGCLLLLSVHPSIDCVLMFCVFIPWVFGLVWEITGKFSVINFCLMCTPLKNLLVLGFKFIYFLFLAFESLCNSSLNSLCSRGWPWAQLTVILLPQLLECLNYHFFFFFVCNSVSLYSQGWPQTCIMFLPPPSKC